MPGKGSGVAAALRHGGFPATSAGAEGPAGVAASRIPGRVAGYRHCVRNAAALAGQWFRANVAALRQDFAPRAPQPAPDRRRTGPRGQNLGPGDAPGPPDGGGHPGPAIAPPRTRAAPSRARPARRGPALAGRRHAPAAQGQSIAARIPAASGCPRANSLSRW